MQAFIAQGLFPPGLLIVAVVALGLGLAWSEWARRRLHLRLRDARTKATRLADAHRTLRARLKRLQALDGLGVLAGGIAHDFNNLLVGVMGNAEILQQTASLDEVGEDCVQQILSTSDEAADLARQMLLLSGRETAPREPTDLNHVVVSIESQLKTVAEDARVSITVAQQPVVAKVDGSQLQSLLLHLAANQPPGGELCIRTGTDTIPNQANSPSHRDHFGYLEMELVEPWSSSNDPVTSITAHALEIANVLATRIAKAHDGRLKSRDQRDRTTLRLVLPLEPPRTWAAADDGPLIASNRATTARGTILVADDERTVLDLTRALLELEGWQVITVGEGELALEAIEATPALACLLLGHLPGMETHEALARLTRASATLPVILMRGLHAPVWSTDHPQVVTVVSKPFQTDELLGAVTQAMQRTQPISPTSQQNVED